MCAHPLPRRISQLLTTEAVRKKPHQPLVRSDFHVRVHPHAPSMPCHVEDPTYGPNSVANNKKRQTLLPPSPRRARDDPPRRRVSVTPQSSRLGTNVCTALTDCPNSRNGPSILLCLALRSLTNAGTVVKAAITFVPGNASAIPCIFVRKMASFGR